MTQKTQPATEKYSLSELCQFIIDEEYAYDDLAEVIEKKASYSIDSSDVENTVKHLSDLADHLQYMEGKSDETIRDLCDIYLLIGDVLYATNHFEECVQWYEKGSLIDDRFDVPLHSLGMGYLALGKIDLALKSFKQELKVAPGNYFTYFIMVDIYEYRGELQLVEELLNALLERDHNNVMAMHRLITFFEKLKSA